MTITVTLTSDFVCPWCFIGERRLQQAIRNLAQDVQVTLVWQPYELNPTMPVEGVDRTSYRIKKFGSLEYSQMLDQRILAASANDDIHFNHAAILKTPNTFKAHRLMGWARQFAKADDLANALFSGYFEHGRDIGDSHVLAEIAAENGLERAQALAYLNSDAGVIQTRQAIAQVADIQGVPNFDIDGEIISGAHPVGIIQNALQDAITRKRGEQD
ncbi:DsbA family oxidoreductase [Providencia burhodogranariea]|uniref:Dsba oxidoreductase n=1 Tax=Providencia burhodogranariea DSM 19968 TaxID=1141662 RepID=K8WRR9_9GAMM|nr:DsbA family oxidoreductase [Providencia burhodogranariea]EKT63278.1 dsba oxidoreductase [Providencia burhodogranariea DSM 19968]